MQKGGGQEEGKHSHTMKVPKEVLELEVQKAAIQHQLKVLVANLPAEL